jgi:RimJ/RimL family protein N-acetyltransferase
VDNIVLKRIVKKVLGTVFSDYRINILVASHNMGLNKPVLPVGTTMEPVTTRRVDQLTKSQSYKMRNSVSYTKAGLCGYVLVQNDVPVCVAHFAYGNQYDRTSTWPLNASEVALMDIATEEAVRGQGHAVTLIGEATSAYYARDVSRIIAFVWWNNHPSLRAFAKAGWRRIGISFEFNIGGAWRTIRLPLR